MTPPPRTSRWLRSALTVIASTIALTAALLVPAVPAEAASATGTVSGTGTDGLRVRAEPNTTSTIRSVLPEGTTVVIDCQTTGTSVTNESNGRQSSIWNFSQARNGYVPHAYIAASSTSWIPGVPRCGASTGSVTVGDTGGVGIRVRSQPNTSSTIMTVLPEGTQITVRCQATGTTVTNEAGQTSSTWDFSEQHNGYVPHTYMLPRLPDRISGVPLCTTEPPPTGGNGTPVPGIPQPCANNRPYPTGVSTTQALSQLQSWSGITFADGNQSWASNPTMVQAFWQTMAAVECTPFLSKVKDTHRAGTGRGLVVRAQNLGEFYGWYTDRYGRGLELNIDLSFSTQSSVSAAKRAWIVIHELTHPYNGDRNANPIYWQRHNAIYNQYGALSRYGAASSGGPTENIADMFGYFVARCAQEGFGSQAYYPYGSNTTKVQQYWNLSKDLMGRSFGPAPGGTC